MKQFNLLPGNIVKNQRRRRMLIGLSVGQTVILAVVICSFPVANFISDIVLRRSAALIPLISDSRYAEPDLTAERITELNNHLAVRNDLLTSYSLVFLESEQLETAIKTVPAGAQLTGFDFTDGFLTLNCKAADLNLAEQQRQNLDRLGFTVSLGTVALENDMYFYSLRLGMREDI